MKLSPSLETNGSSVNARIIWMKLTHPENFTIVHDMVFYEMLTSLSAWCHMEKVVLGMTVYTRQCKLNLVGHDKFIAAVTNRKLATYLANV
jgi:hypothetical protein